MKANIKILLKAIVFVAITAFAIWGIYKIADIALLGRVANWFEKTFFLNMGYAYWANGGSVHVKVLQWNELKDFILKAIIVLGIIWAITISIAYTISSKTAEKKTVQAVGKMLRQYFSKDTTAPVFPRIMKRYRTMQRHLKTKSFTTKKCWWQNQPGRMI